MVNFAHIFCKKLYNIHKNKICSLSYNYLVELAEGSIEGRSFNVKTPSVGFLSPNNFQIHLNKRAFALVFSIYLLYSYIELLYRS
jgi:hypothetical protein